VNRIVIFEKNGRVVFQLERLSKAPSGNGAERRKAIRSGWHPEWVKSGQPSPFTAFSDDFVTIIPTGDSEIKAQAEANDLLAREYACYAHDIVEDIVNTPYGNIEPSKPKKLELVWVDVD